MGEAKRRKQSGAPVSAEHRRMAVRIDARFKQFEAQGMQEAEIFAAMSESLPDFHHLIVATSPSAMDTLCSEFAGFYRFAKIIETIAAGIAAGKVDVPGGKTVNEEHRIAAAIDQRVRQLEATGITGAALLEPMVGHMLDLQRLWSTTSDETLASLCRKYPGLYRYGVLMEAAVVAQAKQPANAYSHLPELPDSLKAVVSKLLSIGTTLEGGLQSIIDATGQRDLWMEIELLEEHYQNWTAHWTSLPDALRATPIPEESRLLMMQLFEAMAQRINHLRGQIAEKRGR